MQPEHHRFRHFDGLKRWLHDHPTALYALIGAGLIIAASIVAFIVSYEEPRQAQNAAPARTEEPEPKPVHYAPLTGVKVASEARTKRPVTAIMIENSPDARPQSGLKDAEVVYEAVAEGGVTRFLALYQQKKPSLIGPVRSLRPYYLSWARPYDASIVHVGGSYNALRMVRSGAFRDVDQFFNPDTFWRSTDRFAPHNVYTNFKRIDAVNKAKKYTSSSPATIERTDSPKRGGQKATRVAVNISGPSYDSVYYYDRKTKLYKRHQAGAPHADRERGTISAKVVVAIQVDMSRVFEDGYRESITTGGSGTARIFTNGRVLTVKWSKKGTKGQLTFEGRDGKPVELARGTTWIAAVPNGSGSVSWK